MKVISNRLIFIRPFGTRKMEEVNIMFELNMKIKKLERVLSSIKMVKVLYFKKKAILVFLLEDLNAEELIVKNQDKFIKVVKSVNIIIIKVKLVIKQYKLKLTGILLFEYLKKKKPLNY